MKLIVEVVGRLQMIFLEVDKGVSEWHQGRTESVEGGIMASVSPATSG